MAFWTILFLFGKYSVLDLKKYFGPDYFVKGIKNVKFFPLRGKHLSTTNISESSSSWSVHILPTWSLPICAHSWYINAITFIFHFCTDRA